MPALAAERSPEVSAYDLSLLEDAPTPNELFFVREHNAAPRIGAAAWRLSVGTAYEMGREELLAFPRTKSAVTLECAENPAGGGLVSHAVWEGVPLAQLLDRARPAASTRFVRLEGFDGYERILPIEKARDGSVLVASRMNGELLPANHGGPARALVAGRYGMDSVKWLRKVELLDAAPASTGEYVRRTRSLLTGVTAGDPVGGMLVKSVFARPVDGAVLSGRTFTVRGAAWGEHAIVKVELSADDGKAWSAAKLGKQEPYCWTQWEWLWKIPAAGKHALIARATDAKGNVQPMERDSARVDPYEQNACQRVQVTAR
ncbi:MAG: molybdopterin-dependent oxidoreductase [Bryobacteraceae bacterium]